MALGGAAYRVGVQAARILKSNPRPGFVPGRDVEAEGNKTGPRGLPPFAPTTNTPQTQSPVRESPQVQVHFHTGSNFTQSQSKPRAEGESDHQDGPSKLQLRFKDCSAKAKAVGDKNRGDMAGIWTGDPQGTQRRCSEEPPPSYLPSIQHQVCSCPVPLSGVCLPFIPGVPFRSKASPKTSPLRDASLVFGGPF